MRIPFWQRDEAHPRRALDRVHSNRSFRKVIGIDVCQQFSTVNAALIKVRGAGRFSRVEDISEFQIQLEPSAQQLFLDLQKADAHSDVDLRFAASELASYQTICIKSLMAQNNSAHSEVIAAGVMDPGIWANHFDEHRYYRSLTDATQLATQTSMTIIDRFRERDIADGGTGDPLLPFCYWFLFADRNEKIAEEDRVLVLDNPTTTQAIWLPASDGLDAVIPDVQYFCSNQHDVAVRMNEVNGFCEKLKVDRILCPSSLQHYFPADYYESLPRITADRFCELLPGTINAAAVGLLASFYVDQLPASIPSITGNQGPKVLGSVTPGSLSQFRQFVLETAKVSPSEMKLRDAI